MLNYDKEANTEGLQTNLELIDEVRNEVVQRMDTYKEKTKEYFAKKTRIRKFNKVDLFFRATEASDPRHTDKLMPKWEYLYKVKHVLRHGSYKLERLDGTDVNNTWHGDKLRKYYT